MIAFDDVRIVRGGQTVLAGATFTVGAGQMLALLGRDGAGKTSVLEALMTLVPLIQGDIRIDGHSVRTTAAQVRMRAGYVPAVPAAWPRVRADEWLELFAREAGLQGKPLRRAVAGALALAAVDPAAAIDTLPAGRAKLLLFGRALLHAPDVLAVDDPFGGLDPRGRETVERLLLDFHLGGRTVVAAIDDGSCPACATHLAILRDGGVAAFGPAAFEAFDDGQRPWRCRLGCPAAADEAAAAIRRLGADAQPVDGDLVECRLATRRLALVDLVASLVRAGIPVATAGFHPHWTAQLLEDPA